MATRSTRSARFAHPARHWLVPAMLIVGAASLHAVPQAQLAALDAGADRLAVRQATSAGGVKGEDFPGSAYFFAEDAFAAAAPTRTGQGGPLVAAVTPGEDSPHVLVLDPGPPALSMPLRSPSPLDQARALQCLANAIYYEAGNEPEEGQRAVAQVIMNRIASGRWPASVCGAIYQGAERADRKCQFTFSCDGSMGRPPVRGAWAKARAVAWRAMSGEVYAPVGLATYYHTLAVHPAWADDLRKAAVIGAHIFYRLPGPPGEAPAYRYRYGGSESARPGPYAYAPPSTTPSAASPERPDIPSVPPVIPISSAAPTPALPSSLPRIADPSDRSTLPQSTIRSEYRNSGRPLF